MHVSQLSTKVAGRYMVHVYYDVVAGDNFEALCTSALWGKFVHALVQQQCHRRDDVSNV